jgi:hypothetical protein
MIARIKPCIQRLWRKASLSDIVAIIALPLVYYQLSEITKTNTVSIRGQLYQTELGPGADEARDDQQNLTTLWAQAPPNVTDHEFYATLIRLVTDDPTALKSKTAKELYHSMFDATVFADPQRRAATNALRRLFLYTQNNVYHVHNAFDYRKGGILRDEEWITWKNLVCEMNAHPMLLTVIWHGYRYRYFSRDFGRFLQRELFANSAPCGNADSDAYKRGKEFIRVFYPEMLKDDWPNELPGY